MIGAYTDITELKNNEAKMKYMAYFDALTGLRNRVSLMEYVNSQVSTAGKLSLIYFDMDNFKLINDTYGHSQGDILLREIGSRISSFDTKDSKVFRIGGDEFVIILNEIFKRNHLETIMQKLINDLKKPIFIGDNSIQVSISAGIVCFPEDGETFEELLKNADAVMYDVKENGKNSYRFFDKNVYEALIEQLNIERSLRTAIENKEFKLYYQPQVDTETGQIKGFEALLRWFNSTLGSVPPSKFIKFAEESGLIISIGEWVIKTACNFAARLHESPETKRFVSINISTLQLRQENFVEKVKEIIDSAKINPAYIHMEITETVLMDAFEDRISKLNELRAYGVEISLDDFGTGYSSLTYLRKLPINTLKIDKSFIDDISTDADNQMIINTIIQLAHSMKIKVVAEGVEELEQYALLVKSSCDLIQGYYISKPVPEEDIFRLIL
jgi:diguanylate cyclase (GGDEF)-like protein